MIPDYVKALAGMVGNPLIGAEVGVRSGKTTEYLLDTFPTLSMYAVDAWQVKPRQDRPGFETYEQWNFAEIRAEFDARMEPFGERVTVLNMDSLQAATRVEDGSLDFVFIDAEHTYEAVLADIAAWRPKVRSGGLLTGHDYDSRHGGLVRAVDETFPNVGHKLNIWFIRC